MAQDDHWTGTVVNGVAELREEEQYLQMLEKLVEEDRSAVFAPQLDKIMRQEEEEAHFGVYVDSKILLEDDLMLGHMILRYPENMLRLLSKALYTRQECIAESEHARKLMDHGIHLSVKKNIHARVNWLPGANRKPNVSSLRSIDVNTFVQFAGTITRSSSVRVLEAVRVFECNNESCTGVIRVFASKYEVGNMVEKPTGKCPSCNRCSSYTELKEKHVCQDYQELKVQEQVQKLGMGSIPRSITVILLHDLVDQCKAGDDVVITGVPFHRWSAAYVDERCNIETVIDANTVQIINAASQGVILTDEIEGGFEKFWSKWCHEKVEPIKGRNLIIGSICPQLYGLFVPKLAVSLALTGCPTFEDKGTKVRGELHLLMVGDPGTGKSQLLRYAAKLAPRSVLTTGTGTTSAGLTCSAVREGHEFMLEAGALVLADRGVCCIDEFGSIRQHDRATIHEAMEQQTLSVAKAGLVCTLKTRTTLIAATNPKGSFDSERTLSANTGIAPPLLSRFDMVLVMLDKADQDWDRTVSEFILREQAGLPRTGSEMRHPKSQTSQNSNFNGEVATQSSAVVAQPIEHREVWDVETFQAYLTYIKRLNPQLSPEAATVLTTYYKAQRGRGVSEAGRTTLRLLESLIRLAKTHARLMARETVVIVDAIVSVELVEMAMSGMEKSESAASREGFPDDPDEEMWSRTQQILEELGLRHLISLAEDQAQGAFLPDKQEKADSESVRSGSDQSDDIGAQLEAYMSSLRQESQDSLEESKSKRNRDKKANSFDDIMSSPDSDGDEHEFRIQKRRKRGKDASASAQIESEFERGRTIQDIHQGNGTFGPGEDALEFLTQANSLIGGQKQKKKNRNGDDIGISQHLSKSIASKKHNSSVESKHRKPMSAIRELDTGILSSSDEDELF